MESFITYIFTALALVLVIEGLLYAFFTDYIRKMMATALQLPSSTLRNFGLFMASIGIFLVWLIERF